MSWRIGICAVLGLLPFSAGIASASEKTVLLAPVQGSEGVRHAYGTRVRKALTGALRQRGYTVAPRKDRAVALVSCAAPECTTRVLDKTTAEFGVVPAIWAKDDHTREITLTLVGGSGRTINAGTVMNGDLSSTIGGLLDELLTRRAELEPSTNTELALTAAPESPSLGARAGPSARSSIPSDAPNHPNAWKSGPILLWASGAGVFVAIGVAAATKGEHQRLRTGAVAAWSAVGGAALLGGVAWWIMGKRRQAQRSRAESLETAVRVSSRGFDLRLRF